MQAHVQHHCGLNSSSNGVTTTTRRKKTLFFENFQVEMHTRGVYGCDVLEKPAQRLFVLTCSSCTKNKRIYFFLLSNDTMVWYIIYYSELDFWTSVKKGGWTNMVRKVSQHRWTIDLRALVLCLIWKTGTKHRSRSSNRVRDSFYALNREVLSYVPID